MLKGKNAQAYSTIARKIKKRKVVLLTDVTLKLETKSIIVNHLVIRVFQMNNMYHLTKTIDLASLITGEIYRDDREFLLAH